MADKKLIKDDRPTVDPHPQGQFSAVCIDVIDLGLTVETYQGKEPHLSDKVALVFRTDEERDGKPMHIAQEFTASMGKKSNLRKFLQGWRGKDYTDDEVKKQGIPLDKLEGAPALLTVAHKVSQAGNTYAYISGITPLPRQMKDTAPTTEGYERPAFWADKKREYQAKAEAFQPKAQGGTSTMTVVEDDDDLPF